MAEPRTLRLVFWNTFLLHPHPIPGGPGLPAIADLAAPAVPQRATAIGKAIGARFDIAAFAEAFEPADHARIVRAWGASGLQTATGPARSILRGPLGFASSGLFTVVAGHAITRQSTHRFVTRGSYLHDADALANKGVLLTEIDLGGDAGRLELYSTHLCWGTGLLPGRVALDPRRRHATRMAQLDELVTFVQRTHRPGNVVMVVGDFNVPAFAPDYPDGPTLQYDELTSRLGSLGLRDVWATNGSMLRPRIGDTCGAPTDDFADQRDPDDSDALVDGPNPGAATVEPSLVEQRERIDYVFLADPDPSQRLRVDVGGVRRYAFPRASGAAQRSRLVRLSDHLAIGVDLIVTDPS